MDEEGAKVGAGRQGRSRRIVPQVGNSRQKIKDPVRSGGLELTSPAPRGRRVSGGRRGRPDGSETWGEAVGGS